MNGGIMDYLAIVKERAEGKDLSVLGGSVKFVVDENVVFIDGNSGEISSDDNEATCTISTDADTMQSIMDGSSSPQAAFMTGKLKVSGDMSIALKVQSVIS
jgi:putative sterol carrier protein|tara:strand:- start:1455 stop:1757 length:303 start_codon:yes stop_codon:yes gene_type:complete